MMGGAREGCMWMRLLRRVSPRRQRGGRARRRGIGLLLALAGLLTANRARAEGVTRLSIEWEKLGKILRWGGVSVAPPGAWRAELSPPPPSLAESPVLEGFRGLSGLSLLARDWDTARLLMGRLSAVDQVRHGRSWRMALLRGRFAEGPIAPFVQLGLGQWRVDPDSPAMPHDVILAGQVGAGVELALSSWASIAIEVDCTALAPEHRYGDEFEPRQTNVKSPAASLGGTFARAATGAALPDSAAARWVRPPALWGSFLAARATF